MIGLYILLLSICKQKMLNIVVVIFLIKLVIDLYILYNNNVIF